MRKIGSIHVDGTQDAALIGNMLLPTIPSSNKRVYSVVCALGIAAGAFFATQSNASASLIGYYTFENTTNDVSGNSNPNNPNGGSIAGYVAGYQGQAASFNGTNSYLQLPINISPSQIPSLTMGAWVSTSIANVKTAFLSADDDAPGDYDRHIGIDNRNATGDSTSTYSYSAFGGGGTNTHVLASGQTPTTAFTFVAVRYTSTDVSLFVGNQKYSFAATPTDQNQFPSLWVGKNPKYDSYFTGAIDNVFVFDQALTDAQINTIRTDGVTAVPEPSTLAGGALLTAFSVWRLRASRKKAAVQ